MDGSGSTSINALQVMNQHLTRLERFDGENFSRWQETMKFFLITVKLFYILEDGLETIPEETATDSTELKAKRAKRKEDDFLCRGHILNALSTSVYNAHRSLETAKALWTALESKYRISEASNKKFLICNFMDFKMVANKSIVGQVSEILLLVNQLKDAKIDLPEAFVVGVIISRLPNSWNDYKKKLKHAETDYDLDSLQRHLRIEEDSRKQELDENPQIESHSTENNVQINDKLKPKNET